VPTIKEAQGEEGKRKILEISFLTTILDQRKYRHERVRKEKVV